MSQERKKRKKRIKKEPIAVVSPLVTPAEAAKMLLCDPRTINNMIQKGQLGGQKVGGRYKVSRASLESFLHRIEGRHISSSDNYVDQPHALAASASQD